MIIKFTARSRAQKEAMAPPIEWPVTTMPISPYKFLACRIPSRIPSRRVVL